MLEAGWKSSTPGFWQAPDASATLDGALFNKTHIIDSFSKDMEMQTWKRAAGHSLSSGMEKRHHHRFCQEGQNGSIPNQFFCVHCDQRALATRKHELWECPGNRLINHAHMEGSEHLVAWRGNSGTQIKFCLSVVFCRVTGYLRANSQNIRRSMFLVASDGSGGSRETPKSLRQVAFGVATFSLQPLA